MEKKKLKLGEVKVNSFITQVESSEKETIDGGVTPILETIHLTIVSYVHCREIGEDLGEWASDVACPTRNPGQCLRTVVHCTNLPGCSRDCRVSGPGIVGCVQM